MAADDSTWVLDSLVGFLQGPVWNAPILTFIEEKSAIFDPEAGTEHECEYRAVFEDYKSLVDGMLGSLVEDLGMSAEQFEKACSQPPAEGAPPHFHKRLLEQVWAANDYEIFRRMMLEQNLQLQLQTLELIRQQTGAIPDSCRPSDEQLASDEAPVLEAVTRQSLQESGGPAPENTRQLQQQLSAPERLNRLRDVCRRERRRLDSALQLSLDGGEPESEASEQPQPEPEPEPADGAAVERRRAYLRQQRDRLLQLKRSERERQLQLQGQEGAAAGAAARPRSAQAAQRALRGPGPGPARGPSARTLAVRRALADRLRAEVVGAGRP